MRAAGVCLKSTQATLGVLQQLLACAATLLQEALAARSAAAAIAASGQRGGGGGGRAEADGVRAEWAALVRALREAVRARLPEPQVLVAMYTALQQQPDNKSTTGEDQRSGGSQPSSIPSPNDEDAASDGDTAMEDTEAAAATEGDAESMKALLRLRVLDVLEAYQRHLPEALADANFSPAKFFSVDPRFDSPPLQLATLRLLRAADDSEAMLAAESMHNSRWEDASRRPNDVPQRQQASNTHSAHQPWIVRLGRAGGCAAPQLSRRDSRRWSITCVVR